MKRIIYLLLVCNLLSSCSTKTGVNSIEERGKKQADELLDKIANGTADSLFANDYFDADKARVAQGLKQLKDNCDLKNRKGQFVDFYYDKDNPKQKADVAIFIYEFHLSCDNIRFIIGYKVDKDKLILSLFKLESTKKDNAMIKHNERRIDKNKS